MPSHSSRARRSSLQRLHRLRGPAGESKLARCALDRDIEAHVHSSVVVCAAWLNQLFGMSKIFISYRREESFGHARALGDALARRFGPGQIFLDVDDLPP